MNCKSILSFIGTKINRWTILEDLGNRNHIRVVSAICECGIKKEMNFQNIRSGKSQSCGCLSVDHNTKHGLHEHPLYCAWEGMVDRCYNKNSHQYHRYGGRGVKMCKEWRYDPKSFYEWAINNGWRKGLHLDKDKLSPNRSGILYSPNFCCFISAKENSMYKGNSRLINHEGKVMCAAQWADKLGIKYHTFMNRYKLGWSFDKIVNTPVIQINKKIAS